MQVCSAAGAGGPRSSPAAVAIAPAPSPAGPRPLARAPVDFPLQFLDPRRSQVLTSKRNRERRCWRVPDAAVPLRGGRARPHSTHTWPWEVRVTSRHPSPTSTGGRGRYTKPALDHEHKSTCASPCGGWPSAWPYDACVTPAYGHAHQPPRLFAQACAVLGLHDPGSWFWEGGAW